MVKAYSFSQEKKKAIKNSRKIEKTNSCGPNSNQSKMHYNFEQLVEYKGKKNVFDYTNMYAFYILIAITNIPSKEVLSILAITIKI